MLRPKTIELRALKLSDLLAFRHRLRHRLAMQFGELRFIVEGVDVSHPAGHVQPDDPLRFRACDAED